MQTVVRALQKQIEVKFVDGYFDSTTLTDVSANDATWAGAEVDPRDVTGTYGCLPMPSPGDGYSNRDGRKIFVKKIEIRGLLETPGANTLTAATNQPFARILIVKDKRADGVQASAENVIGPGLGSDGNQSLSADAAIMQGLNPDGIGRYQIIADKIIKPPVATVWNDGTDGAAVGYATPFTITFYPKCYVNFDGNTGKIGSIVDNAFHMIAAAGPGETAFMPKLTYTARTYFVG